MKTVKMYYKSEQFDSGEYLTWNNHVIHKSMFNIHMLRII